MSLFLLLLLHLRRTEIQETFSFARTQISHFIQIISNVSSLPLLPLVCVCLNGTSPAADFVPFLMCCKNCNCSQITCIKCIQLSFYPFFQVVNILYFIRVRVFLLYEIKQNSFFYIIIDL